MIAVGVEPNATTVLRGTAFRDNQARKELSVFRG
jgi:hypothetical protein